MPELRSSAPAFFDMKNFRICAVIVIWLTSISASAHEFWLWPSAFSTSAGSSVGLSLNVGEYFEGERIGFAASQAASLRHHDSRTGEDLTGRIPGATVLPEFRLTLHRPGTHLFAYDSEPNRITLQPDKFHAYLHDEGLDDIIELRKASSQADQPGRERYRRCVKSLLQVTEAERKPDSNFADNIHATRTGQRLEIIPLTDPSIKPAGSTLDFLLLFDGKPLANRLLKAWHKHNGQTLVIRTHSAQDGKFSLTMPYAGPWMISVVHMIRANDSADVDWDSYWGNLTFEMAAQ